MRTELRACLVELRGVDPPPGLGMVPTKPKRPPLADRARLWELAIRLGRELGTEVDATPDRTTPAPGRRRVGRVDYGGA